MLSSHQTILYIRMTDSCQVWQKNRLVSAQLLNINLLKSKGLNPDEFLHGTGNTLKNYAKKTPRGIFGLILDLCGMELGRKHLQTKDL